MKSFRKMMKDRYKKTKRSSILVYFTLRILVIICAIFQGLNRNYFNVFICILALVLFTLPTFIQNKFEFELPNTFETIVYFFIFSAEILGEINKFYIVVPHFDTILHTINGFLCSAFGFALVDLFNNEKEAIKYSPIFIAIVAFCFSMTIAVLWEIFEYGSDRLFSLDMQKDKIVNRISSVELNQNKENKPIIVDNITQTQVITDDGNVYVINGGYLDIGINDTMKDLIVNMFGAIIFGIIGFMYLKKSNKNNKDFAEKFIPKKIHEKN